MQIKKRIRRLGGCGRETPVPGHLRFFRSGVRPRLRARAECHYRALSGRPDIGHAVPAVPAAGSADQFAAFGLSDCGCRNASAACCRAASSDPLPRCGSACCSMAGLLLHLGAKLSLRRSFGIVAADRGIKIEGPYRLVRHPMYLGYMLVHLALLLAGPLWWNATIFALTWILLSANLGGGKGSQPERRLPRLPGQNALPALSGALLRRTQHGGLCCSSSTCSTQLFFFASSSSPRSGLFPAHRARKSCGRVWGWTRCIPLVRHLHPQRPRGRGRRRIGGMDCDPGPLPPWIAAQPFWLQVLLCTSSRTLDSTPHTG